MWTHTSSYVIYMTSGSGWRHFHCMRRLKKKNKNKPSVFVLNAGDIIMHPSWSGFINIYTTLAFLKNLPLLVNNLNSDVLLQQQRAHFRFYTSPVLMHRLIGCCLACGLRVLVLVLRWQHGVVSWCAFRRDQRDWAAYLQPPAARPQTPSRKVWQWRGRQDGVQPHQGKDTLWELSLLYSSHKWPCHIWFNTPHL